MRETTFEVELRTHLDAGTLKETFDKALSGIYGVKDVSVCIEYPWTTLKVRAAFPDKKAAIKVLRKISNAIIRIGIPVPRSSTNITEAFGGDD